MTHKEHALEAAGTRSIAAADYIDYETAHDEYVVIASLPQPALTAAKLLASGKET